MASFLITTEQFEGPIDALLQMIEKRKLPINDISLSAITDDYITFIQTLDNDSIANKTHFIFIASTLALIKSKSLLPSLNLTDEEEGDIDELKQRIKILKGYQETAHILKSKIQNSPRFYFFEPPKKEILFQPHKEITEQALYEALSNVLQNVPEYQPQKKEAYVKIAIHIEEMMDSLEQRIMQASKIDFEHYLNLYTEKLTEKKEIRLYRLVGFLAVLELTRKGILQVVQQDNFANIEIENI